ncbi:hypothetical protein [Rubrivirga marina]|uniref:Uncharacterized protein n=1 Tax=Rubrivirga marina TaxID=1196024 RepID=A0A271IVX9_9BACT|nr:hypothetical protein [Rubrivirga marina]PAP75270.1 hypothetical protein BSZ37_01830 [Rubrivirga marina]
MNNLFRTLIAGYGAKKLGGGCFSTVIVFILLFWLLGQCGSAYPPVETETAPAATVEVVQTAPAAVAGG